MSGRRNRSRGAANKRGMRANYESVRNLINSGGVKEGLSWYLGQTGITPAFGDEPSEDVRGKIAILAAFYSDNPDSDTVRRLNEEIKLAGSNWGGYVPVGRAGIFDAVRRAVEYDNQLPIEDQRLQLPREARIYDIAPGFTTNTIRLWSAIKQGNNEEAERLIAEGADVNSENMYNVTPLFGAIRRRDVALVRLLLTAGAEVNTEKYLYDTPLFAAIRARDSELVRVLIGAEANVNARDGYDNIPLMIAVSIKDAELVRLLLEAGADPNVRSGINGEMPLCKAIHWRDAELVRLLLEAGANPNVGNRYGRAPLFMATERNNAAMVQALIGAGANVDLQDNEGKAPLHYVRDAKVVQALIGAGANVDLQDNEGKAPLHYVRDAKVVQALIGAGANVNVRDGDVMTPLHYAVESNRKVVVEELLEVDAEIVVDTVEQRNAFLNYVISNSDPVLLLRMQDAGIIFTAEEQERINRDIGLSSVFNSQRVVEGVDPSERAEACLSALIPPEYLADFIGYNTERIGRRGDATELSSFCKAALESVNAKTRLPDTRAEAGDGMLTLEEAEGIREGINRSAVRANALLVLGGEQPAENIDIDISYLMRSEEGRRRLQDRGIDHPQIQNLQASMEGISRSLVALESFNPAIVMSPQKSPELSDMEESLYQGGAAIAEIVERSAEERQRLIEESEGRKLTEEEEERVLFIENELLSLARSAGETTLPEKIRNSLDRGMESIEVDHEAFEREAREQTEQLAATRIQAAVRGNKARKEARVQRARQDNPLFNAEMLRRERRAEAGGETVAAAAGAGGPAGDIPHAVRQQARTMASRTRGIITNSRNGDKPGQQRRGQLQGSGAGKVGKGPARGGGRQR